jgi:hypothetical protein
MGMMQHPGTQLLASNVALRPTPTRLTLPHRKVTPETIDDAYAQFILYCNPAVPPETDTAVLREAFKIPPKSGGKSFSTYTLFELIGLFQSKEIKTWADLALQLGVEPPDQDKGQSAQKIQQYAVRLKVKPLWIQQGNSYGKPLMRTSGGCTRCISTPSSTTS